MRRWSSRSPPATARYRPATYFGQFVDHDITRDTTTVEADDPTTDAIEATPDRGFETMQGRSPSLDLDSLYGHPNKRDENLFVAGTARFKIGRTVSSPGGGHSAKALDYDLPRGTRRSKLGPDERPGGLIAALPDERNDENLAVGQTHLMWMLFRNQVVKALERDDPTRRVSRSCSLKRVKKTVTRHYQYIVLHDFIRQFITGTSGRYHRKGQAHAPASVPG
ncbi:MAG: hypothetical protein R3C97_15695 [Geminicoccaceae bacterium]